MLPISLQMYWQLVFAPMTLAHSSISSPFVICIFSIADHLDVRIRINNSLDLGSDPDHAGILHRLSTESSKNFKLNSNPNPAVINKAPVFRIQIQTVRQYDPEYK